MLYKNTNGTLIVKKTGEALEVGTDRDLVIFQLHDAGLVLAEEKSLFESHYIPVDSSGVYLDPFH